MKTADELRAIAKKAKEANTEHIKREVESYIEENLKPVLEEVAESGRFGCTLHITDSVDVVKVAEVLHSLGYEVHHGAKYTLNIYW